MSSCPNFIGLECKKVRRTGFGPAFLAGALLAAAFPVIQMAARTELFLSLPETPVKILLDANWQLMAMLNILLVITGACLLYHTEYAEHAILKMCMLPIRESSLYAAKAILLAGMCLAALLIEAAVVILCGLYWFPGADAAGMLAEAGRHFGVSLLLTLPVVSVSLGIASAFENMWVSLGIGVVCVFTATLLPTDVWILSLFPYALPFQTVSGLSAQAVRSYLLAGAAETLIFSAVEALFLRIRKLWM